jgi:hypothetical protein
MPRVACLRHARSDPLRSVAQAAATVHPHEAVVKRVICGICHEPIVGPRLVVEGWWACSSCVYQRECGDRCLDATGPPGPGRASPKTPQTETLFPVGEVTTLIDIGTA